MHIRKQMINSVEGMYDFKDLENIWKEILDTEITKVDMADKNDSLMYFILSSESVNLCDFPSASSEILMKPEDLIRGLEYAFCNFYQPVFIHSDDSEEWLEELLHSEQYGAVISEEFKRHTVRHIKKYKKGTERKNTVYVFDDDDEIPVHNLKSPAILNIDANNIAYLADRVRQLLLFVSGIYINLMHADDAFELDKYEEQLLYIEDMLIDYYGRGKGKEICQLTDGIFTDKIKQYFAGESSITLAPDGKVYPCPAFFFYKQWNIDISDVYQCRSCIYQNCPGMCKLAVSLKMQDAIVRLERKCSAELMKRLQGRNSFQYEYYSILPLKYDDLFEQYNKKRTGNGTYWSS